MGEVTPLLYLPVGADAEADSAKQHSSPVVLGYGSEHLTMVELMHDEATLLPEEGQRDGAQVLDPSTDRKSVV